MKIGFYALQGIAHAITDPYFLILLFFIGLNFYRKNRKTVFMQKMIIGESINSSLELTFSQIVIGLLGGIIGSFILSYLGIAFPDTSVIYMLFLFSIILMFIKPKLICFSYSGAILAILILILNFLKNDLNLTSLSGVTIPIVNIVSLITLIGVMHIVEGLLVMIDGSRGAVPVFTNQQNKIMGGFALSRYWSVPISLMLIFSKSVINGGESIAEPSWWPLINTGLTPEILKTAILIFMPFYAVVGYNNITFTKSKKGKSLLSGCLILIYGVIICFIAQLAHLQYVFKIIAILLTPILHEGMLYLDTYIELKSKPKYISSEEGLMVLEVAPNSPAKEMGIESGDLLVSVNNTIINSEKEIFEHLRELQNFIWLKVKKRTGEIKELSYNRLNNTKKLGIVFVPKNLTNDHEVIKINSNGQSFQDILEKIKKKDSEEDK